MGFEVIGWNDFWNGFIRLRIGTSGGLSVEKVKEFYKMRRIS